jgi:hypothetical protein
MFCASTACRLSTQANRRSASSNTPICVGSMRALCITGLNGGLIDRIRTSAIGHIKSLQVAGPLLIAGTSNLGCRDTMRMDRRCGELASGKVARAQ